MTTTRATKMNIRQHWGFSLVETLVAITILLIAVLVPMRIITQSIKTAAFSREQLTAVLLAQEGIEAVIQQRDGDVLDGGSTWGWLGSLDSACTSGAGCDYDASDDTFISCSGGACQLYIDDDDESVSAPDYYYSHDSDDMATPYTRELFLDSVTSSEVEITAEVSWTSASLNDAVSIIVQTTIFDQYAP